MSRGIRPAEEITPESNVDDLITRFPATARVFVDYRMACVGCEVARFETIGEACAIWRRPVEPLLSELRRVVEPGSSDRQD